VTIHSSKGLEWPVVILINTVTRFRPRGEFVHRPSDDTLHWVLGDVVPPALHAALEQDEEAAERERERLFYVAFTRARDLLVLPKVPHTSSKSWTAILHDPYQELPELDVSALPIRPLPPLADGGNEQTSEVFANQQRAIANDLRHVSWVRPSLDDVDRLSMSEFLVSEAQDGIEVPAAIGAGQLRGLLLHKMLEEILTGELADETHAFVSRARDLLAQLTASNASSSSLPDADELAATITRALGLSDIAQFRHGLVPELSVFGTLLEGHERSVAGRADAVFVEHGEPQIVFDWKSDIQPSVTDIAAHAAQLRIYMRTTKVSRGALVYLSSGKLHWLSIEADDEKRPR
jgi:ATP-dependent exoDNAse (exonuclease V) beta subunit